MGLEIRTNSSESFKGKCPFLIITIKILFLCVLSKNTVPEEHRIQKSSYHLFKLNLLYIRDPFWGRLPIFCYYFDNDIIRFENYILHCALHDNAVMFRDSFYGRHDKVSSIGHVPLKYLLCTIVSQHIDLFTLQSVLYQQLLNGDVYNSIIQLVSYFPLFI